MRRCKSYGMALWAALFLGALLLSWSRPATTLAQRGRTAVVEVAAVQQQTIAQPVTFVATVEPSHRSQVASEIEGIVEQLYVEEGQHVTQGKPLLRLRQERLRITLKALQATASRYRQELKELQNGSRPEVVEEARAAVEEAEAELARARRERGRQLGLSARGVTAVQSREDADTAFEVAQKRLLRVRKQYEVVVQGPRPERIAQAEAQYRAAQAEVARVKYDVDRSQVLAPFSGFVITKHTDLGEWLGQGDPVMTLIELSQAHITVPIPERYLPHVALGSSGLVQFDALPNMTTQGKVIRIIPQATASRTFPVTVEVANPQGHIKSGFFARVTLTVGEEQNALLVPKDAIVTQGPRQIVYAVRDQKATPVPVERRTFYQGFAVVTGPLKAGEHVVIRGNERLRPGQAVRIAHAKPR